MKKLQVLGLTVFVLPMLFGGCSSPADEKVIVVPGWGPSSPGPAPSSGSSSGTGSTSGSSSGPSSSSSSGGSSSGGTTGDGGTTAASGVPCDVATMLAANCTGCHSDPPATGALAGLVTYADLKATAHEDATKNEAQLSVSRMQDSSSPMPPGGLLPASDVTTLQNWINAGYPMGSCATGGSGSSSGGGSGDGGSTPPPTSVFNGQPPFTSQTGNSTHNAGRDCMQCHATGGGDAPQFSFGGTLYDGNGNPVVGAEVRLVDANGNGTSVHTGPSGTFYSRGSGFAAPAHVGARNASSTSDMLVALQSTGGGCSSCHCTGTGCSTTPIHLP